MTNYSHGHDAEKVAARYLEEKGYSILALNWRRPRAEIDIIAQRRPRFRHHGPVICFEVKYRKTDNQGRGFDYVTPRKLAQMQFAAELWATENNWGGDYALGALELAGPEYSVTGFLEEL